MRLFLCGAIACLALCAVNADAQQGPAPGDRRGQADGSMQGQDQGLPRHPPGPPPNIQLALKLLDQAKQQNGADAALIEQAEALLKKPPGPPPGGGMEPAGQSTAPSGQGHDRAPSDTQPPP